MEIAEGLPMRAVAAYFGTQLERLMQPDTVRIASRLNSRTYAACCGVCQPCSRGMKIERGNLT